MPRLKAPAGASTRADPTPIRPPPVCTKSDTAHRRSDRRCRLFILTRGPINTRLQPMDDLTRHASQQLTTDSFVAPSPARPSVRETLVRLRYRYWPDQMLGEILAKRWTETAIPVIVLIIVAFALSRAIDGVFSPAALSDAARQAGEIGCVVL